MNYHYKLIREKLFTFNDIVGEELNNIDTFN